MHRESFIELMLDQLNFLQLHRTITVHVGDLIVFIQAEVGAWNDLPNLEEVQTFQSDRCHLLLFVLKVEFVETFTLLIDLDPSVIAQISEDFVLSLQAKLLAKLAARLCAHDIVMSLLARCGLERSLCVIENTIAIDTAALEVSMVIVSDHDNLLACLHLLDDLEVGPVKDLDVSLV